MHRGLAAGLAGVTDRRFLPAALGFVQAAKTLTAGQPRPESDGRPETRRLGQTGPD
ncbi:hypothetical protein [Methylobacterium mesophilicum]|uniref:hypothetical protein n=1 Tax=Methylobacterium mesophilicum TaxID=39956 RepID=UPI0003A43AC5|nr:hypothetical protein [Methylobacterium mesophilicum]